MTVSKDISLVSTAQDGHYTIIDNRQNNEVAIGRLIHPTNSHNKIELYCGKGGFTAIVTSPNGLKYFALPGAKVVLGDTTLELDGPPITSRTSRKQQVQKTSARAQQAHAYQAMILGAGLATRFEPISGENTSYAKPAVPLLGQISVIRLIADTLFRHGFTHLYINTFFKPDSLKAGLADSEQAKNNTLFYIDETGAPSGTAGGLRKILETPTQYHFDPTQPILVVQGDAVTDVNFSQLMEAHVQHRAFVTIGCQYLEDKQEVSKFGIIETDQRHEDQVSGHIHSFVEKPQPHETDSQLANTGFYIFSPEAYPVILEVFQEMGDAGQQELDFAKHIFPKVLKKVADMNQLLPPEQCRTFWAQKVDGYWSDIGNPSQYLESLHDLYQGNTEHPLPDNLADFYDRGVIYWPGAKAQAQQEQAHLEGNIVVAKPFSA